MIFSRSIVLVLALLTSLVSKAETITLNGEDDWAPYSSASKDYKEVVGLAPDIVRAAFKSQGIDVIIRPMPFTRCMNEVDKGTSLGCFDTLINKDTKDKYIFHPTALFQADMLIYGRIDEKTGLKLEDLEGKTVGTTLGYTYPSVFLNNKKILTENGPTETSQLQKVAAGRVRYAILWGLTAESIFNKHPELKKKVKLVGRISRDNLYVNFSKTHKDGAKYAAIFEKGLQTIISNGTYLKIEDEFRKKHPDAEHPRKGARL
ncbi:transporter substrate-binding domain-containing protein [Bdellovibrio sp. SKB1291214]|uniref:substrate-binding periplasmic protein n=1 Tax=Bdellovibrio sp. SKB1291214 TaxID=1732569 RepID=UPI000B5175A0|nr:transporter substrate-binding domain-containing protein [Bdellovibrio sp. SKB1291214]UYL10739.1 transporter substrate-binding domain-containing protein [Bdellovibrio sp. SKB1291214]